MRKIIRLLTSYSRLFVQLSDEKTSRAREEKFPHRKSGQTHQKTVILLFHLFEAVKLSKPSPKDLVDEELIINAMEEIPALSCSPTRRRRRRNRLGRCPSQAHRLRHLLGETWCSLFPTPSNFHIFILIYFILFLVSTTFQLFY